MPTEVKDKYSTAQQFNILLTGLKGSTLAVGRASDFVDNTATRYQKVIVYTTLTQAATVSGNKSAYIYGLRCDNVSTTGTDGVTGDMGVTFLNAPVIGLLVNKSSPTAGENVIGEFIFDTPGPKFGIGVHHDMASNLTTNTGENFIRWIGINPEAQ